MLNRMVDEKILIKLPRPHATLDYMYSLKGKRKPLALSNYDHELACADVFVGFKSTGQLEDWAYYPNDFSTVEPDRKARLTGIRQDLYLEIDRGTEPGWKLEKKILWYPSGPHQVIFVAPNDTRADQILGLLESTKRGNQFLVTLQDWIANPLSEIFVSPLDVEKKHRLSDFQ